MKNLLFSFILIHCASLVSCDQRPTFLNPQPEHKPNISLIPNQLKGNYFSLDSVIQLIVTDYAIIKKTEFNTTEYKDSLAKYFTIKGDSLYDLESNKVYKIIIIGDSAIVHVSEIDTIFNLSASNILRQYKGYYFISTQLNDNSWDVKKIYLHNSALTISTLSSPDDIDKLKDLKQIPKDSILTHVTLTHREFRRFLKHSGFSKSEVFYRM